MFNKKTDVIESVLSTCIDPYLEKDWVSAGLIQKLDWVLGKVTITATLPYPAAGALEALKQSISEKLLVLPGVKRVHFELDTKILAYQVPTGLPGLPQVKNIIAIASGKGGVGKSTCAVNLALALHIEGARVGILDADIYGPSQPLLLGGHAKPTIRSDKKIEPLMRHGLQVMSIGYLLDGDDTPVVWRGPMVSSALQQLLNDTAWHDLDYLIIDLPPGTGDIQLTLSQKIPVAGAVIVTTPQDMALLDAKKGLAMFRKVNVPVLGLIENMSAHICQKCGHEEPIFGEGGGKSMASEYQVILLGSLPLDMRIRADADRGVPSVITDPQSHIATLYRNIARKMAAQLSLQPRDLRLKQASLHIKTQ